MLGFSVGMAVGGVLFPQKQPGRGKLDDLRVTGSAYGVMIPQAFGTVRLGGNVIWSTDLVEHTSDHSAKGGPSFTEYTYTVSCAVAICRGPINRIKKIWAEDVLIFDVDASPQTKYNIAFYLGTEDQMPDSLMESIEGTGNMPAYRGLAYVVFEDFLLTDWGNRIPSFTFEVDAPGGTVEDILTDVAGQCGLTSADYDFSNADIPIHGFPIAQRTPGRDALESLLRITSVDLAEIDGKLVAIPRGCANVTSIDEADLGAHVWQDAQSEQPVPKLVTTRQPEIELPQRLDVTYFSLDRLYEQATQGQNRETKTSLQDLVTVNTPLVMQDSEARAAAAKLLYTQWLERTTYQFSLGPKYLPLAPGSPIYLPVNGDTKRCRVTGMDIGLFGELHFTAVEDDDTSAGSVLSQSASLGGGSPIPLPPLSGVVPTTFAVFSCPQIRDEDGLSPGFYVAATGPSGWNGAAIYYSPDGGTTWLAPPAPNDFLSQRSVLGVADTTLSDGSVYNAWDTTNTVEVSLSVTGALTSTSQADVQYNNANAALLGDEIVGFAAATLDDAPTRAYTLSMLLRGRRDSDMSGHSDGEKFIVLSTAMRRVTVDTSLVGQTLLVKCVSPGQALTDVTAQSVVICAPSSPFVPSGNRYDFSTLENSFYIPLAF